MVDVVGADVWRKGWVAVGTTGGVVGWVKAFETFAGIVDSVPEAKVVAVDIPIGLPENPPRRADVEARRLVGPRASSVFPTPPRSVLEADSYEEARALSVERYGRGVSAQSYALRHRILEVDAVARGDDRVIEIHPEVSFRMLAGQPLDHSKKTWNGQAERRRLLAAAGLMIPDHLDGGAGSVPPDDVLDAAVGAWSGNRYLAGLSVRIPGEPADGFGLSIWA